MAGYIKGFCPKTGVYSVLTVEKRGAKESVVNYSAVEKSVADKIGSWTTAIPQVSSDLLPCAYTASRTPNCSGEHAKKCKMQKGGHAYQCLFCSELKLHTAAAAVSSYEIFFVLDQSGSMSGNLKTAADATRKMVKTLSSQGNNYHFVAFGSDHGGKNATYWLFSNKSDEREIATALNRYEKEDLVGGGTDGRVMENVLVRVIEASKRKPVRVIVVTDGEWSNIPEALSARDKMIALQNVEIFALGIGDVNQSFLSKLGTVGEFSKVVSTAQLGATFAEIAKMLQSGGHN